MQCPTCGSFVAAGDVCPECGMDLEAAVPPAQPVSSAAGGAAYHTIALDAETAAPKPGVVESTPGSVAAAILTLQRNGAPTSYVFPIGERVTLGRFDPSSGPVDVDLAALPEAGYVSRHHAAIWRDISGQWRIMDLESRNGTYVRSDGGSFSRVGEEHALQNGDEVALGNARFRFEISNAGEESSEPRA
jgi:hypothetical protein